MSVTRSLIIRDETGEQIMLVVIPAYVFPWMLDKLKGDITIPGLATFRTDFRHWSMTAIEPKFAVTVKIVFRDNKAEIGRIEQTISRFFRVSYAEWRRQLVR